MFSQVFFQIAGVNIGFRFRNFRVSRLFECKNVNLSKNIFIIKIDKSYILQKIKQESVFEKSDP